MRNWIDGLARRRHSRELFSLQRLHRMNRDDNIRLLRQTVHSAYLGDNRALCRVLGRYVMSVDTRDEGLAPHLVMDGFWEMGLTEAIVRRTKPGMNIVDGGANVGYFTLLFAGLCGPRGQVVAVEPDQDTVEHLRRSVRLNGFSGVVRVVHAALGAECGEARLLRVPGKPMNAHVDYDGEAGPTVSIITMDRLVDDVDLIKIDVEGSEERVWAGMSRILDRPRPLTIFLEFNASRLAAPGDFLRRLTAGGQSLHRLEESGETPVTMNQILETPATLDQMLILER